MDAKARADCIKEIDLLKVNNQTLLTTFRTELNMLLKKTYSNIVLTNEKMFTTTYAILISTDCKFESEHVEKYNYLCVHCK